MGHSETPSSANSSFSFIVQGMKFAFELVFWVVIFLLSLSLSWYGMVFGFSTSRIHMFAMLNTVIWAILVKSARPSAESYGDLMSSLHSVSEAKKEQTGEMIDNDDNKCSTDSDNYQCDSNDTDGYHEEDDKSNGNDESNWDDDNEEYDDTLNSRIEEFIAKVVKGWREEQMEEDLEMKQVDLLASYR